MNLPPLEMKSWKSGEKILWQIWHDQNLMYLPPPPPTAPSTHPWKDVHWTRMERKH